MVLSCKKQREEIKDEQKVYVCSSSSVTHTITAAAGCGNKPAAENSDTASPQAVPTTEATAEDTSQQVHDDGGGEKNGANSEGAENNGQESTARKTGEAGNDAAGNNEVENLELIFCRRESKKCFPGILCAQPHVI